jgi:tetratricopeptide (TPR) repeat protein
MTVNGARVVRWLDGLVVVEFLALTFLLGCFLDRDTDIWFHLRAGREMLAGHGIPRVDSYIFAVTGAEWIDLHWAFQIAAAWLYARGGFAALTIAAATLAATAAGIALVGTTRRRSVMVSVWCFLPAVFVMSARFYPRPEMVSLACLAAFLCILHHAARNPRLLWLLVPVQFVWVNVQGLFVLGPIVLATWLADRAIRGAVFREPRVTRQLVAACFGVVLVCFINPYGWKGVAFPLTLFQRMSTERGFYGQQIGELMSVPDVVLRTGISSVYLRISFLLLAAAGASFLLLRRRTALFWFRFLTFVAFAVLGVLAVRNQPQFALVAGAVLAWNVGDWHATRLPSSLVQRASVRIVTSAILVGLMLWVATGQFYAYAGEARVTGLGEHPHWYGHDAARFAAQPDMPRNFVAYHEGQAAVLEFHMRPEQRVFVDPRLEVAPRNAFEQYYDIASAMARRDPRGIEQLLQLPQPLGMLVNHSTHFNVEAALLGDPRWQCIWFDAVAGVYVAGTDGAFNARHAIDFGAKYFGPRAAVRQTDSSVVATMAQLQEAEGLFRIGRELVAAPTASRPLARTMLLLGVSKARDLSAVLPYSIRLAHLVASGSVLVYGTPDPQIPVNEWEPEMLLAPSRARYVLNRIRRGAAADFQSSFTLFGIAQALGDPDAVWSAGEQLVGLRPTNAAEFEVQAQVRTLLRQLIAVRAAEAPFTAAMNHADLVTRAQELVDGHRFLRALTLIERSLAAGLEGTPPWELVDLRARLFLLAGDPERARSIWLQGAEPGTPAGHSAALARRLGNAYFVEGRLDEAAESYRAALAAEPSHSPARYGLAITELERGDPAAVVRECEAALQPGALSARPSEFCRETAAFARRYLRQ